MSKRHRSSPDEDIQIIDEPEPQQEPGDNAFLQSLIRRQLGADPVYRAHQVRSKGFYATQRLFEADRTGFGEQMDLLDGALASLIGDLARMEHDGAVIDALMSSGAEVSEETTGELVAASEQQDEAFEVAFTGPGNLGFWLWPTEYGTDGSRKLVGMYDREGQLPEAEPGSAGVGPWIVWAGERREALDDLLARADAVRSWAVERAGEIPEEPSLVGAATLLAHGRPPELAASAGREHQYLVEVLRDEWPDWAAEAHERDLTELRQESAALDAGVDPARLGELDAMVTRLAELEPEEAMAELSELEPAERRYVFGALRTAGAAVGSEEEGLTGYNTAGTVGMDMLRGAPGSVANVGWGMVKSVPILGDLADWQLSPYVNAGIGAMNAELGMDADSSAQQAAIGQLSGQVAGTIGLAGFAGPARGATALDRVKQGLFAADTTNGLYQGISGKVMFTEKELPGWARALALMGATVNLGSGGLALRGGPDVDTAKALAAQRKVDADNLADGQQVPELNEAIEAMGLAQNAARSAEEAEKLYQQVALLQKIGKLLTGLGATGATAKTTTEGVDEDNEREDLGLGD
jgi:hypothetical protein